MGMYIINRDVLNTFKTKEVELTTATTQNVWVPTATTRFVVTGFDIEVDSGTGVVSLYEDTDTAGKRLAKRTMTGPTSFSVNYTSPVPGSAADKVLKVTTSAAMTVRVRVRGYEI